MRCVGEPISINNQILDTIISFFPRRWGRNKPDFSGVHRGIRSRLEHLRPGEIQSIHDLTLIIMNQCSTVFFDRTKPADARPQVLDIFANAIAHVVSSRAQNHGLLANDTAV
jgi:hypothetical protein